MDFLRICCAALLVTALVPEATGQVFAPGELSKAHAPWKSLGNCDKCHSTEDRVDRAKCLSCHRTVGDRIARHKGYHGQKGVGAKPCDECHKEHRGTGASLIPWPGGSAERFDHRLTGRPLRGAHAKLPCQKCHDPRRITDRAVTAYLKANPKARTQQGLPTDCHSCHFDEHRKSLGAACDKCHGEEAWKPVPKFKHDQSWRLEGAHQRVACDKCHKPQKDPGFDAAAFPVPRAATYLTMKPVAHEQCTRCHVDPHQNRFGSDCLSCHQQESWGLFAPPKNLAFHDKTAFPLKGRHRFVPCGRCHPKDAGGKTILKPIAHDKCGACHPNAHPDIPDREMAQMDCARCHDNSGFKPSRFSVDDHAKTRFPLDAAHRAAACATCHLKKMGAPVSTTGATRSKRFLSSRVISPWRLRGAVAPEQCAACHASPHRDQFKEKPCTACHDGRSWTIRPGAFDHNRKTRYPLTGKHASVACNTCHAKESDDQGTFVRYRPRDFKDCTPCHVDRHYGQFAKLSPKRACRDCHATTGFLPTKLDHNDPERCPFPLRGKHAVITCDRCHPAVNLTETIKVTRYRPTMSSCDGCHEDFHTGAYRNADALLKAGNKTGALPSTALKKSPPKDPWAAPKSWYRLPDDRRTDCRSCHQETGWDEVRFDHAATRFPLKGLHKRVACEKCHVGGLVQPLPLTCEGCHRDPHRGGFGTACTECHTEEGFEKTDKALARHNRTNFPLTGRHAAVPCSECHRDARSQGFNRAPTECVACHEKDIPRPGEALVEHSGLSRRCESCHTPVSFQTASFAGHDRCFPIGTTSKHGAISCTKCHRGSPPSTTGDCGGSGFSCTQCHTCLTARHRGVSGYVCEERRCYECHRHP